MAEEKITVTGTRGCSLLASVHPMHRAEAEGEAYKVTASVLDEAKALYEKEFCATHDPGKFEFMRGIRDIQKRGGFGLNGGFEMIQRLQPIADGATECMLAHTPTVDALLRYLVVFLDSKDCRLTSIDLRHTRVTVDGVILLAQALRHNALVERLRLTQNDLPIQELRRDVENAPPALDFSNQGFSPLDTAVIGTMLCQDRTLEFLNLSGNSLTGPKGTVLTGFIVLTDALADAESVLTTLVLRNVMLRSDGLVHLAKVLQSAKCLKEVDVSDNPVAFDGFHKRSYFGLQAFASVLRRTCSVETLTFRRNQLDCHSVQELARILGGNGGRLKTLDLSENPLNDAGVIAVALELQPNGTLESLRLSDVDMKRRGCIELCSVLEKYNYTLKELDISKNLNIGRPGRDSLVAALHENPSIVSIQLPEKDKYSGEDKHIRGLARANKERLLAQENLERYDFETMNESCLTNFIYKLNYLDESQTHLLLRNATFQRRRITADNTPCLRHYSNTTSANTGAGGTGSRLARNLLRVLDYTERRRKIEELLDRYDNVPEIDQPMYWNIDL